MVLKWAGGLLQVIRGSYSAEQQAPDADLGKSLREGFRNTTAGNEGRVGGSAQQACLLRAPWCKCSCCGRSRRTLQQPAAAAVPDWVGWLAASLW
jgi:hypothetical protein